MKKEAKKINEKQEMYKVKLWKTDIYESYKFNWWKKLSSLNNVEVFKLKNQDDAYILLRINIDKSDLEGNEGGTNEHIRIIKKLNQLPEFLGTFIVIKEWSEEVKYGFEILTKYPGKRLSGPNVNLNAMQIINFAYSSLDSFIALEKNGIFHSDIKPDNLLFQNDKITLVGFYVCRDLGNYDNLMKMHLIEDVLRGKTTPYSPPEIIQCEENEDHRKEFIPGKSDVYNWGMTFFQMLSKTSTKEINELKKSYKNFIVAVKKLDLKDYPERELIKQFVPILLKTLEYDPINRPTFSEVRIMMDSFMELQEIAGNITLVISRKSKNEKVR